MASISISIVVIKTSRQSTISGSLASYLQAHRSTLLKSISMQKKWSIDTRVIIGAIDANERKEFFGEDRKLSLHYFQLWDSLISLY